MSDIHVVRNDEPQFDFCQGCREPLYDSSEYIRMSLTERFWRRLKLFISNGKYHFQKEGVVSTLRRLVYKILGRKYSRLCPPQNSETMKVTYPQLDLQPGEWVEVKSESEILATLDSGRRNQGLLWMAGMEHCCGKRYRVFKRLRLIKLESTGQTRKVKNTVILEGAYCDGNAFGGCDRSCFYYWREIWLKRVENRQP